MASCLGWAQAAQVPLLRAYHHQAWGADEGAPAQIRYITQTTDGYLWLSSDHGLYRFDGTYFDHVKSVGGQALQSEHVLAVLATRDGGLWVSYRYGGASFFKDGTARHYGAREGLQRVSADSLAQAPDGSIWSATTDGLYQFAQQRWRRVGIEQGLVSLRREATAVLFGSDGTQWVGTEAGIFQRRPGASQFSRVGAAGTQSNFLAEGPAGAIWASDTEHRKVRQLAGPAQSLPASKGVGAAWFDRSGIMWLARHASVERLGPGATPDASQRISTDKGLSGPEAQCFFEDRSGNIWIGTQGGLDRLRPYRAQALAIPMRMVSTALARGRNGTVWISEINLAARRFSADGKEYQNIPYPFAASVTAPDGSVRLASRRGIWIEDAHGGRLLPTAPEALAENMDISTIGLDDRGIWWASFRGLYLGQYVDGAWRRAGTILPSGETRPINMLTDRQGQLWMAFFKNSLLRYGAGKSTVFNAAEGLELGDVSVIQQQQGNLWVGGSKGLAYFDGARFHSLGALGRHVLRDVSGIVETASGDLWLRAFDGLFRLRADALKQFLNGGAAPAYTWFDAGDGVPAPNGAIGPFPSLLEASDGRLWITGNDGVATLEPAQQQRNVQPPHPAIRSIGSNGTSYPVAPRLVLPEGSNNLRIGFTALNLSRPERTTFRYRLAGVDAAWQAADGRHEAVYSNLAPGRYRFEVTAVNEDGVASLAPAVLEAVLTPTFLQSGIFKLLCGAVAAALLAALIYIVRLRQQVGVMEARYRERTVERQRIARALHDTLLQESQGAILLLQVANNTIPAGHPARVTIDRVIGFMEGALADGRDEVMGLRSALMKDEPVHLALQRYGQRMAENLAVAFAVQTKGAPYRLAAARGDDAYAIAREAMVNAFRHAAASRIVIDVDYGSAALAIAVRDDGAGFPPDVSLAQGRHGHYGLAGMQERASGIGADLAVRTAPGGGTEVVLRVPTAAAH